MSVNVTELLTRQDVAVLAGLQPESISRYVRRGTMPEPAGRVGREPVWTQEQIDKWLEGREG